MKKPTKKQRQCLWFVGLRCASLSAVFLMAYVIRWMLGVS